MTSVATVFGHLPLVFVSGPGRGGAQQHRHRARRRDGHRHACSRCSSSPSSTRSSPRSTSPSATSSSRTSRSPLLSSCPRSHCREHSTTNPRRRGGARRDRSRRAGPGRRVRRVLERAGRHDARPAGERDAARQPRHSDRLGARAAPRARRAPAPRSTCCPSSPRAPATRGSASRARRSPARRARSPIRTSGTRGSRCRGRWT